MPTSPPWPRYVACHSSAPQTSSSLVINSCGGLK
ncbi:hypothetical protein E2C01_061919 [Portunus trituberculatus]|uniref:Uncharacterized protein n=1 Tax=Portunus trituberculatus TaxID=210409 RepID=A0A5B7HCP0_PORTR|nr:hypothetical protein [Portunus trituberculatus]